MPPRILTGVLPVVALLAAATTPFEQGLHAQNPLRERKATEDLGAALLPAADGGGAQSSSAAVDANRGPESPAGPLTPKQQTDEWLDGVIRRMRQAEKSLAAHDVSRSVSAVQREAVNELDSVIEKLAQQCKKCEAQCQGQPKPGENKPGAKGGKPGQTMAKEAPVPTRDRDALSRMIHDIWGDLPQRQRDELLQPLSEEFVPKYADETEAYFRGLASPERESD